jgi:hypothetical protein
MDNKKPTLWRREIHYNEESALGKHVNKQDFTAYSRSITTLPFLKSTRIDKIVIERIKDETDV